MEESSLHSLKIMHGRKFFNRAFAVIYAFAIIVLFYYHVLTLTRAPLSIVMFISDFILALLWFTSQSFFMNPISRQQFPKNLEILVDKKDFPAIDIFICTADPYKEPPLTTVNTTLSVLAYDYPMEKLSVYISDDGGSKLILFALMEAAKFARSWIPYCRENKIEQRCPEEYFRKNHTITSQFQIIQVLLERDKDKDVKGFSIPNLIYVSREKSTTSPHHFKAGALNALLRVSKVMTNAPLILTLDCDMYSNDPQTPQRVLCYFCDPSIRCKLGYVQFPQRYHGLNEDDMYGGDNVRTFRVSPSGLDGLGGPDNCGTGCFFNRQALFDSPLSSLGHSEHSQIHNMTISSVSIVELACHVASSNYEHNTGWGTKMGIKYGTLVEDIYTGYMMHCDGWNSIFCNPERPAFLGEVPINLEDALNQVKRWSFGHLEVLSCEYSPLTFGTKALGLLRANCYIHYVLWPIWCIPVTLYACVPQLSLLNNISIFPKVFDPWFFLYVFLFFGAYAHDFVQFILFKGTAKRWWNDQRMWYVKALSPYLFASIEYLMKKLGITSKGFNITSKVAGLDERKLYDQSVFSFANPSPMFVPLATVSIINLIAFLRGIMTIIFKMESLDEFFIQVFIAGFAVVNCLPIYEAMLLRSDHGRMPKRIVTTSVLLSGVLCIAFSLTVS
ncbi:cellulose synthase-like protein G2 isoform X2 [Capsicum annuum]|uniref:cellulose synthase-like protein G2 isoform X2 n=1 Tax=Capsicum annuum TaxID=4072 RepID=UPI001FB1268F|nr:cellulose synthase-like protein G2 isoform X2 [Capsicum annuum]